VKARQAAAITGKMRQSLGVLENKALGTSLMAVGLGFIFVRILGFRW
jgi:hypothetical protein